MSSNEKCPAGENWVHFRLEYNESIKGLREDMREMVQNSQVLPRIGTGIDLLVDKIETSNQHILEAAIGKEHIPVEVVEKMMSQVNKNNATLFWIFGTVCLGLLSVIVFLLIGEKAEWIRELFRNY